MTRCVVVVLLRFLPHNFCCPMQRQTNIYIYLTPVLAHMEVSLSLCCYTVIRCVSLSVFWHALLEYVGCAGARRVPLHTHVRPSQLLQRAQRHPAGSTATVPSTSAMGKHPSPHGTNAPCTHAMHAHLLIRLLLEHHSLAFAHEGVRRS